MAIVFFARGQKSLQTAGIRAKLFLLRCHRLRIGEGGGKAILLIYMKSKTAPIIVALLIPIVSVAVALSLIYFKKKNVSGLDEFPYSIYNLLPTACGAINTR